MTDQQDLRRAAAMAGAEALRAIQRKDPKFENVSLLKMAEAVLAAAQLGRVGDGATRADEKDA